MIKKMDKNCVNDDKKNGNRGKVGRGTLDENGLNTNQLLFCEEYLKTRNATKSYRHAYGDNSNTNSVCVLGAMLLRNVNVENYLKKRLDEIKEKSKMDLDECLLEISKIARSNIGRLLRKEGGDYYLDVDLKDVSEDDLAAIEEISTVEYTDEDGNIKKRVKIKLRDKLAAAVQYGKHLGGFEKRLNVTVQDSLADSIKQARSRVAKRGDDDNEL